jgi:predicted ArsR family transcriptional regulator
MICRILRAAALFLTLIIVKYVFLRYDWSETGRNGKSTLMSTLKSTLNFSENEQSVLDLLRFQGPLSVSQLCGYLKVTATAIRQRLTRLNAAGLIERFADRRERGRPVYQYRLTTTGMLAMGENLADLAEVLWLEVLQIADPVIRQSVIDGVLDRLTAKYRNQVTGKTITERLQSIARLFRERKIPFVVEGGPNRSEMRIVGCPYPRLNDQGKEICELEQQLVTRLLDAPVALKHCQCNSGGGQCCTFTAETQQKINAWPGQGLPGSTQAGARQTSSQS